MVYLFILVGQAGIQVGAEFWKLVDKEYSRTHETFYNSRSEKARCILVDSEPKVIQNIISHNKEIFFENNSFYDQPGRGNNWAFGYYDKRKNKLGDTLLERVMMQAEKEINDSPSPPIFILIHSLAGGTGSGLGSRITTKIRETYKEEYSIVNVVITPYEDGEVTLQSYNSLLCLSELTRSSDTIFLLSNERTMRLLANKNSRGKGAVSVNEINQYFGKCLAGLLFPTNAGPVDPLQMKTCMLRKYARPWENEKLFEVNEFLNKMCPKDKNAKFIELLHSPLLIDGRDITEKDWSDIAADISNVIPKFIRKDLMANTVMQIIARGDKNKTFKQEFSVKGKQNKLVAALVKTEGCKPDIKLSILPSIASVKYLQSITVCLNTNFILGMFEKIYENASAKFEAKAYVHWYRRYGCTDKVFESAFLTLQNVIVAYQNF